VTKEQGRLRVFTVVEVWRGFADRATSFLDPRQARAYMRVAKRRRNLLEDDVQLFEQAIKSRPEGVRRRPRRLSPE
jgi:hypothetical protein